MSDIDWMDGCCIDGRVATTSIRLSFIYITRPIHPTLYGCTLQGTVALMSRANQKTLSFASKPKPLSARWVLDQFRAITITKGDKAQGRKVDVVKSMMVKCQGSEAK